jgi:uncharacterized protein with ParB-like and HNH nuclease domain
MSYNVISIRDIVESVNREYFLPAIQRPFVWEPDKIVALFDSLMKGYPISSFLFWEIKPENRQNWDIYSFIDNFKFGETHNQLAEPDGREITLVLDGQQRLTSLLIGLRGSYTAKLKHKRWDNPDAWRKQKLYFDLLKDPISTDDNDDLGITYGFKFFERPPLNSTSSHWIKVGQILDFDSEDEFDRFKDKLIDSLPGDTTRSQENLLRRNLERIYRLVWKEEAISYFTERNQSYDRVLDIFIRANDGGTKLSKSDLLLSMITSKWGGVNAREEIYNFVDTINNDLDRRNNFDKDFVMRSCLVVSDLDQRYNVNNFTTSNLAIIQDNWELIKHSIKATIRLINKLGIDRDTLTSANALMPIIYYFSKIEGNKLDGTTPSESLNIDLIRNWLIGALLNNVFGGTSDSTIGTSRAIVKEAMRSSTDFPYSQLVKGLRERGRISDFSKETINDLLDMKFSQRRTFLALSLLYDNQNWGSSYFHVDHIIPRSLCRPKDLRDAGISEVRASAIANSVDNLGNLQLLLDRENLEKSNQPFEQWIQTRSPQFLDTNLIPKDPELWKVEELPNFIKARELLIRKRLAEIGLAKEESSDVEKYL